MNVYTLNAAETGISFSCRLVELPARSSDHRYQHLEVAKPEQSRLARMQVVDDLSVERDARVIDAALSPQDRERSPAAPPGASQTCGISPGFRGILGFGSAGGIREA